MASPCSSTAATTGTCWRKARKWRLPPQYAEVCAISLGERPKQPRDGALAPVDLNVPGIHRLPQRCSAEHNPGQDVRVRPDHRVRVLGLPPARRELAVGDLDAERLFAELE